MEAVAAPSNVKCLCIWKRQCLVDGEPHVDTRHIVCSTIDFQTNFGREDDCVENVMIIAVNLNCSAGWKSLES